MTNKKLNAPYDYNARTESYPCRRIVIKIFLYSANNIIEYTDSKSDREIPPIITACFGDLSNINQTVLINK
jgi:hypothetical protein